MRTPAQSQAPARGAFFPVFSAYKFSPFADSMGEKGAFESTIFSTIVGLNKYPLLDIEVSAFIC